jgi:hypothetical protein
MSSLRRLMRLPLPDLTAEQAVVLVDVLDQVITKIWRLHGAAMREYMEAAGLPYPRPAAACSVSCSATCDEPIP